MKTIFLHIGMHKTGSSAIQHSLNGYDDGITRYATLGYENHSIPLYAIFSGHAFEYSVFKAEGLSQADIANRIKTCKKALLKTLAKDDKNIIFSGEGVTRLELSELKELKQFLESFNAKILVYAYFREPIEFINSATAEVIRSGFCGTHLQPLNYHNIFYKFFDVFGSNSVFLREYSRTNLKNGNAVDDFCEWVGLTPPFETKRNQNVTTSSIATKFIYALNRDFKSIGTPALLSARRKFITTISDIFPGKFQIPTNIIYNDLDIKDVIQFERMAKTNLLSPQHPEQKLDTKHQTFREWITDIDDSSITKLSDYVKNNCKEPYAEFSSDNPATSAIGRLFLSFLDDQHPSQLKKETTRPATAKENMKADSPLIYFVHIPKTAGSFVNHSLKTINKNGYDHCEHFIEDKKTFSSHLHTAAWMSGHVPYAKIGQILSEAPDRPIRYFSCIRDPSLQVMSHLNWLFEIQCRGPKFFYGHPVNIQEISMDVRSNGLQNIYDIMHVLLKYKGLFLNTQSRFLLSKKSYVEKNIDSALSCFEFIGTEKTIDVLLYKMTGKKTTSQERVNESKYHFNTSLFDSEEVQYFLKEHNHLDSLLYERVQMTFNG
ncbi:MAG: hypothetical protein H8E68_00735 [Kiritimatiellaeota bacterium]|nr:hypothetical protein [Kiritimatiellota bacterium]